MVRQRRRAKNHIKNTNCQHGRYKYTCKECGGNGLCEHGKQEHKCLECGGSDICVYAKQKQYCLDCNGSATCEHQRIKYTSTDCDGRQLCKTPHCPTRKNPKYDGHCFSCYVYKFPNEPVARNYRTKEATVATYM